MTDVSQDESQVERARVLRLEKAIRDTLALLRASTSAPSLWTTPLSRVFDYVEAEERRRRRAVDLLAAALDG